MSSYVTRLAILNYVFIYLLYYLYYLTLTVANVGNVLTIEYDTP